jgi:hypothetical protein
LFVAGKLTRDENLGQTDEDVSRRLHGNVDVVLSAGALAGAAVARSCAVDDVLDNGGVGKADGSEEETDGDTGNRLEFNLELAEDGVDNHVQDRDEDDDRDGVKVLHQIVGHAVALHLTGLGNEVARELGVAHPEDGVEGKDLAGPECALQLLDEVVVPRDRLCLSVGLAPGRLGGVGVTGDDHQTDGLESVGDDGTLRRADNVVFLGDDQHDNADAEHEEAHEVCGPEALVHLHEGRGEEGKTSNVDAGVEHHVDPLECDRGVDDHTLAGLGIRRQSHLFAGVLVGDERLKT